MAVKFDQLDIVSSNPLNLNKIHFSDVRGFASTKLMPMVAHLHVIYNCIGSIILFYLFIVVVRVSSPCLVVMTGLCFSFSHRSNPSSHDSLGYFGDLGKRQLYLNTHSVYFAGSNEKGYEKDKSENEETNETKSTGKVIGKETIKGSKIDTEKNNKKTLEFNKIVFKSIIIHFQYRKKSLCPVKFVEPKKRFILINYECS